MAYVYGHTKLKFPIQMYWEKANMVRKTKLATKADIVPGDLLEKTVGQEVTKTTINIWAMTRVKYPCPEET